MRRAAVGWERAAVVQAAARGWRAAGAIDEATMARIIEMFHDPRVTPTQEARTASRTVAFRGETSVRPVGPNTWR